MNIFLVFSEKKKIIQTVESFDMDFQAVESISINNFTKVFRKENFSYSCVALTNSISFQQAFKIIFFELAWQ